MPGACCYFEICSLQDNSRKISNSRKNEICRKAEEIKTKENYGFKQEKIMLLRTSKISTYFWKVKMGQYCIDSHATLM